MTVQIPVPAVGSVLVGLLWVHVRNAGLLILEFLLNFLRSLWGVFGLKTLLEVPWGADA